MYIKSTQQQMEKKQSCEYFVYNSADSEWQRRNRVRIFDPRPDPIQSGHWVFW